jgi:hypothetical protein
MKKESNLNQGTIIEEEHIIRNLNLQEKKELQLFVMRSNKDLQEEEEEED